MTREKIIQGLQFTIDMFLFDPLTGEPITKPRNDMDKTTIDACKGAIELLEQQPCEVAVSQRAVIDTIFAECSNTKLDIDFAKVLILQRAIKALPPVQPKPEIKPIGYRECSDAMLKMWMDNVLTDGEYNRIMDKLNAKYMREVEK